MLAAAAYYTPTQILSDFEQATGHKARFVQISADQYKSYLPGFMAEEMLENHLLLDGVGYYAGAELEQSLGLLEEKPVEWREFVDKSGIWKE